MAIKLTTKAGKPLKVSKTALDKARKKKLEKELDLLWSKKIHKDWKEKCGWPTCIYPMPRLSSHHWIHRSAGNKARWNTDNGILLCYFHHLHEVHQRGNTEPIRDALILRLGVDGFHKLKQDCLGVWRPTLADLEQLKTELEQL